MKKMFAESENAYFVHGLNFMAAVNGRKYKMINFRLFVMMALDDI